MTIKSPAHKPVYLKVKIIDINVGDSRYVIVNDSDLKALHVKPLERVRLTRGAKSVTAHILSSSTIVERGFIGLPKRVANELGVGDGVTVGIRIMEMPPSIPYIKKKLKGLRLAPEEIRQIVKDTVDGMLDDVELAAFLTAELFYGLTPEEMESLIRAMVDTGIKIEFEEPVYDEHSIGGVPGNSKVALLAVPTIAAAGLLIPKTSSRAITSPAGTADTMEVLARVDLTPEEIKEIAPKTKGLLVWGGALKMAPADDIFIRVLNRIMVDPRSQMVASILSKKLAMSVSTLVIDIPTGKGAKVTTMEEASKLAALFIEQGERLGIKVRCAVSYGSQPVGYSIGPALEAKEALEALMGKGAMSLIAKAMGIAGLVFEEAGLAPKGQGERIAKEILYSGRSLAKMREIIEAQGGNPNIKPDDIPVGDKVITIEAPTDSYVTHVDNTAITLIARAAGAPEDKGAGVKIHVKAGSKVKAGDPLLTIYAESSVKLSQAYSLATKLKPITLEGMILKVIPEE